MLSISGGKHNCPKHSDDVQFAGRLLIVLTSKTVCVWPDILITSKSNTISATVKCSYLKESCTITCMSCAIKAGHKKIKNNKTAFANFITIPFNNY
jgi:hypothetical protein